MNDVLEILKNINALALDPGEDVKSFVDALQGITKMSDQAMGIVEKELL